ncbi:hypothetical protein SRB5_65490 [Streptomyces sp. RB5]|uniref:Phage shock protein PspC N-terminal domain-containing protein n=1 Tax=Streptomyces smaragdinus TaxID=2585196 RepID=A0A7K0CSC1_9ACTN|nr:PspC domain-containing protein [Streptomyces smaragdinus]MQY16351.1 hypothetical protein [Streptomyces smaragdinus]
MTQTRTAQPPREEATEEEAPARDRLTRSRATKMIGGVCDGLGRYYGIDPIVFRVVFGVLAATGGLGLVAYGMAWLLIPAEGEDDTEGRRLLSGRVEGSSLTALLVMVVGCGLFLSMLSNFDAHVFTALTALSLAGACYWSRHRRDVASGAVLGDEATAQTVADAPPEAVPPPVRMPPSWWRDPLTKDGPSGYLWGPPDEPYTKAERAAVRSKRVRTRSAVGAPVFLTAALAGGVVSASTWSAQPLNTSLSLGLAVALGVFGLGFVWSAWSGRTGGGTVFWSLTTAALLALALSLPDNVTSTWEHRTWRPASAAQVRPDYELGTGDAILDLSGVRLKEDERLPVRAGVGAGRLRVILPAAAEARVSADVGLGDLNMPGADDNGPYKDFDVHVDRDSRVTLDPAGGGKPKGTLVLELGVGVGQLEVSRAAS